MMKLCCILTGDDYNLVRTETPASRKKIAAMATVLIIPVTTWFVIGFAVSSTMLGLSTVASFLTGLVTGSAILIIERTILMSGRSKWLLALRIVLGLLIAILGAIFLDEIIFKEDIEQQVFLDKRELIETEKARVQTEYGTILAEARIRVTDSYNQWVNSLADAKKESDGSGGSGIPGIHSIAKLKIDIARQHELEYQSAKKELDNAEQKLEKSVTMRTGELGMSLNGHSILFRIKSLFRLVGSDGWVLAIYLLFTLLVAILEFIVIIMKHASEETHYDKRVETMESVGKRRLSSILQRDHQFYNSASATEPVRQAEGTLKRASPSLFRS